MTIYSLDTLLFLFGTSLFSMSSSNCWFLTCIQVSQEAGQVVWYSHLLQNFPQFIVIHTVRGFGIVSKAEIYVFLELSCFSMIQQMLAIWSLVPLPFLKPAWTPGSSQFMYYWSKFWKLSSGHRTGKGWFLFQSQRKAMPKNAQITTQVHSTHMLVK